MTRREAPVSPPVVLTIAGSDSGGGAGIQADLKTIEAVGGFGTSAITSVTAQNTRGVERSHLLPIEDIRAQIEAVVEDVNVAATKTGMLATADVIDLVAEYAPSLPNLVVDPVMVAASGDRLLEPAAEDAYEQVIAEATLVTPNADEAAVLTDVDVVDEDSAARAGAILVEDHGAKAALVKGGHVPGETVADVLVTADGTTTIGHERVDTEATHGSGCTLSSAIATELATGAGLTEAVTAGIELLGAAVRYHVDVGSGPGAVHHLVALRNDAAVGATTESLRALGEELATETIERLDPDGVTLGAATPYAEHPEDVSVLDVPPGEDGGREGRVRPGRTDPLAEALLAAREADPAVRYALACRYAPSTADAIEQMTAPTAVHAPPEDGGTAGSLAGQVTRAVAGASEPPVAVGCPEAPDGPRALLFARTASALRERTRTLADALP